MAFRPVSNFTHGLPAKVGVLLCNLGTPDAPTAPALRKYLAEFLSDHRVVEIPKPIWWLILHGIILRVRPAKSAAKYASIWMKEGSPLRVWTQRQAKYLQGHLGERGHTNLEVRYAMRYGNPSIASELDALTAAGCTRILILPSYPQYSGTTTASVCDAVYAWGQKARRLPELRFVNHYHDHPGYIAALADRVKAHFQTHGQPEKLVLSFHGVPERTLHLGDPYHCECYKTARLLREHLGWPQEFVQVTFQSRFGKAKWLEPYTEPTLVQLAQSGVKHVAVMCPGFTVDCLETLEEIQTEAKHAFEAAGGKQFDYIECLNDSPAWMRGFADIAEQHLQGWPSLERDDAQMRAGQAAAAKALGSKL
jgi:protoporphyrin/coproporphyrin ferrochelatase